MTNRDDIVKKMKKCDDLIEKLFKNKIEKNSEIYHIRNFCTVSLNDYITYKYRPRPVETDISIKSFDGYDKYIDLRSPYIIPYNAKEYEISYYLDLKNDFYDKLFLMDKESW